MAEFCISSRFLLFLFERSFVICMLLHSYRCHMLLKDEQWSAISAAYEGRNVFVYRQVCGKTLWPICDRFQERYRQLRSCRCFIPSSPPSVSQILRLQMSMSWTGLHGLANDCPVRQRPVRTVPFVNSSIVVSSGTVRLTVMLLSPTWKESPSERVAHSAHQLIRLAFGKKRSWSVSSICTRSKDAIWRPICYCIKFHWIAVPFFGMSLPIINDMVLQKVYYKPNDSCEITSKVEAVYTSFKDLNVTLGDNDIHCWNSCACAKQFIPGPSFPPTFN